MNYRRMERLLIGQILEHAVEYDWSIQGFGMFRLYLSKEVRLHVWDSRFKVPNVSTLHTHPWHFTSTVVSGRMIDRLYEQKLGFASATHMKQRIVCGPGGGECQDSYPAQCRLELLQEVAVEAGKSYGLTASAVHESVYDEGTITLIEREFTKDTEHAYVFFPISEKWVSAEPRPATREEIGAMAAKACAKLRTMAS